MEFKDYIESAVWLKDKRFQHELTYYIYMQFSRLHQYLEDTAFDLKEGKERNRKKAEDLIKLFPYEERNIWASMNGKINNYEKLYVQFLRSTAVTMSYSILEVCLSKICGFAKERFQLPLKVKDINAQNDLAKFHVYLTKVVGLDLKHLSNEWKEINEGRIVRNFVVHNHSNIIKEDKKAVDKQNGYEELTNIIFIDVDKKTGDIIIEDDTFVESFSYACHGFARGVLFEILAKRKKPTPKKQPKK